ncbi:MAG TPA: hypothetical protein VFN85_06165 [Solirubrobacterales bacterium]|nr:hypothetical protein [Solirubrobacterales bacterium]
MCSELSIEAKRALTSGGPSQEDGEKSCAAVASTLFSPLPPDVAKEATVVETAALRVQGTRGLLLFRGAGGVSYFVRMVRESGRWKLAAPAPSELP